MATTLVTTGDFDTSDFGCRSNLVAINWDNMDCAAVVACLDADGDGVIDDQYLPTPPLIGISSSGIQTATEIAYTYQPHPDCTAPGTATATREIKSADGATSLVGPSAVTVNSTEFIDFTVAPYTPETQFMICYTVTDDCGTTTIAQPLFVNEADAVASITRGAGNYNATSLTYNYNDDPACAPVTSSERTIFAADGTTVLDGPTAVTTNSTEVYDFTPHINGGAVSTASLADFDFVVFYEVVDACGTNSDTLSMTATPFQDDQVVATGADQTITAPTWATRFDFKIWGAAGGGANFGTSGEGGFASGTVNVNENLTVKVGTGGASNTGGYPNGGDVPPQTTPGGGGGGRTDITGVTSTTLYAVAGGGGGAAANDANADGGDGGGTEGGDAKTHPIIPTPTGGTQSAGGSSGGGNGFDGGFLFGGNAGGPVGTASEGAGGGGDGYFGGAGGNGDGANNDTGGGGGSGFVDASVSGGTLVQGNNSTDPDFIAGTGVSVVGNGAIGGDGYALIQWKA